MGRLEEEIPGWKPSFFSFHASFRGSTCPLGVLTSLKPPLKDTFSGSIRSTFWGILQR